MRLQESLCEALNIQISKEIENSLKYMQIASYFEDLQLSKLSDYFKKQSDDEKQHANKFMQHINNRIGGKVEIGEVTSPKLPINSYVDVGKIYVETEEATTASIEDLYDLALSEKLFIDLGFLTDMLVEQVEEEDSASKFALNIQMVKDIVLFNNTFGE
jgi:ferritin